MFTISFPLPKLRLCHARAHAVVEWQRPRMVNNNNLFQYRSGVWVDQLSAGWMVSDQRCHTAAEQQKPSLLGCFYFLFVAENNSVSGCASPRFSSASCISHDISSIQHITAQWRSLLQWQNYTNIYSFRNLLFFQDHFSSVLFLHFTLRWRRWEVGKWNWKLVEDTFSFCPSWERMRTLNLIPPQQVTFTWPVATSQPFPWHPAMTATMKGESKVTSNGVLFGWMKII